MLATQSVGRVGITVHALPVILPVHFAWLDGAIVFRTAPGTKLDAATSGAVVAFEVDSYEPDSRSGWSVLVVGRSSRMPACEVNTTEAFDFDALPGGSWARNFVRIDASQVTGRRYHGSQ